jgi:hypothetical protein
MMKRKLLVASVLVMFLVPALSLAANVDKLSAVKALPAGDFEVVVPLEVANTQDLVALDIPLEFSEGAVLDRVEFTDRVDHFEFKHANIDNENRQVIIGMLSMVTNDRPDLATGKGVVANLVFKLDPTVDKVELKAFETKNPHHSLAFYYNDFSTGRPEVKVVEPELNFASIAYSGGGDAVPTAYALDQNWPNPFNPETTLSYALPESGEVELAVFNVLGQKVKTLVSGHQEAGAYEVIWDGSDESGNKVASGIYFYRAKINDFSKTRKMVLLK